jgi:hypothetical protein
MAGGFLWWLLWGLILSDEAEATGIAGGVILAAVGIVRLLLQFRARHRAKSEPHHPANGSQPIPPGTNRTSSAVGDRP